MLSLEIGYRIARRATDERGSGASGQVGAILGAVLGLLGLLLGFSFAAAAARFLERQDLIVTEANAIGTAHLRTDLLDEPHRSHLRAALQQYTTRRLEISAQLRGGLSAAAAAEMEQLLAQVWSAASAGVAAKPEAMLGVLPPVNEVIDLHSTRLAAALKHLPVPVLGLLIASSMLAMGVMGYSNGISGHRRAPLTISLAVLIGLTLWITIDLDHPRAGLLQLNDAPLEAVRVACSNRSIAFRRCSSASSRCSRSPDR